MDIEQLRGWAAFMDKAVVASLVVTVVAVAALGTTTWLSFRIAGAVRVKEQAAFNSYRSEAQQNSARLEQEAAAAQARAQQLEQAVAAANARAGQAAQESASASQKARSAEIDAEEVRRRVEELGRAVMAARARAPAADEPAAPAPPEPKTAPPAAIEASAVPPATSPLVTSLRRYAGTKAALFVLDEARDGMAVASEIGGTLGDAGWEATTWTWSGVSGIFGVVVLLKDGSDPATTDAAGAVVDALRGAGFNATKGDWPAAWSRYRGTLNGPQAPGPAEAPIRIVVGSKAR